MDGKYTLLDIRRRIPLPVTFDSIQTLREVRNWFVDAGGNPDRIRPVEMAEDGQSGYRYIGEDELGS